MNIETFELVLFLRRKATPYRAGADVHPFDDLSVDSEQKNDHVGEHAAVVRFSSTVIEPGLLVKTWICRDENDIQLSLSSHHIENKKQISFLGILSPDNILLIDSGSARTRMLVSGEEFIWLPDNFELNGVLSGGRQLRVVQLLMDEAWLAGQCVSMTNCIYQQICEEIRSVDDLFVGKALSPDAYQDVLKRYFEVVEQGMSFTIKVKSKAFALLEYVFQQMVLCKENVQAHPFKNVDTNIVSVESLIQDNLSKKLPPINIIAKDLAMSESTLKRKFKKTYGKSIYDYYLGKKMELARKLILEDGMQVSEVAYTLSYEKVSHFIEVFKKFYNQSPGKFKRMR